MTDIWLGGGSSNPAALAGDVEEVTFTFDGGGAVLPTGNTKLYWPAPEARTIVGWAIVSDVPGSIVLDVWKRAGAIPTGANTIAGSEKPTLSSQQSNEDTSLTTWTTAVAVGDILGFNIDSVATLTRAVLVLKMI